jgi:hypothetical protein
MVERRLKVFAVIEHGFRPWLSLARMAVCARSAELAGWAVGLASWRHRSRVRRPVFNELHFGPRGPRSRDHG